MIEFNYKNLITFMRCPLKFKFKHVDKIDKEKEDSKANFRKTLRQAFKYFFKEKEKGNTIGEIELKNYWGDIYLKGYDPEDILYSSSTEKYNLVRKGNSYINKFYRNFTKGLVGTVIAADIDYKINYMDKYKIKGNIDLVREIGRRWKKIEIVKLSADKYVPDDFRLKNDISFTINSYAFKRIFEKPEDRSLYYHVGKNKEMRVHRESNDYDKLLTIIDNVQSCMDQEIYYPRISYQCKTCPYAKHFCTKWSG